MFRFFTLRTLVSTPPGHLLGLWYGSWDFFEKISENRKFGLTTRHTNHRRRDLQTEFWAVRYGSGSLSWSYPAPKKQLSNENIFFIFSHAVFPAAIFFQKIAENRKKSQFLGLLGPKPTPSNHDPGGYDIRAAVPARQRSSPPRCNNTGVSTPPGQLPRLRYELCDFFGKIAGSAIFCDFLRFFEKN